MPRYLQLTRFAKNCVMNFRSTLPSCLTSIYRVAAESPIPSAPYVKHRDCEWRGHALDQGRCVNYGIHASMQIGQIGGMRHDQQHKQRNMRASDFSTSPKMLSGVDLGNLESIAASFTRRAANPQSPIPQRAPFPCLLCPIALLRKSRSIEVLRRCSDSWGFSSAELRALTWCLSALRRLP